MRRSHAIRYLPPVLSMMVLLVASVATGCGSRPSGQVGSHRAEALNQNEFVVSENKLFALHAEWLSGDPVATLPASVRLAFQSAAGEPATAVSIQDIKLVMACCRDEGSKPQVESETGANPAERDVGNVIATKSGTWELQVSASVNGGETDTAVWKFRAAAP